ncbi:F-actin-capping protein subunit alpha [Gongronella butleri]|nr:F-actin-capping protein subunit alpha [Gongronella butleri]
METSLGVQEKVDIASSFLLASPPGELNDVFNDVRTIINDDEALQEGLLGALEQYNTEQHTTVQLPGLDYAVVLSKHNRLDDARFYDPRSSQSFAFHHMHLTADDLQPCDSAKSSELRDAVDKEGENYIKDHYPDGVLTVQVADDDKIVLTMVDNKYNANNFWNGRWLSTWTYDPQSRELTGDASVHVHYYEDGNVQLNTAKTFAATIATDDAAAPAAVAAKIVAQMAALEKEFQVAMNASYQQLADETFKSLRRALPLTRNKLDWHQILNYKIGSELAQK